MKTNRMTSQTSIKRKLSCANRETVVQRQNALMDRGRRLEGASIAPS